MTAVSASRATRSLGIGRRRLRGEAWPSLAAASGAALRAAYTALMALRGVIALCLVSCGAWMAYEPAGPIVAGVLILADRLSDTGERTS